MKHRPGCVTSTQKRHEQGWPRGRLSSDIGGEGAIPRRRDRITRSLDTWSSESVTFHFLHVTFRITASLHERDSFLLIHHDGLAYSSTRHSVGSVLRYRRRRCRSHLDGESFTCRSFSPRTSLQACRDLNQATQDRHFWVDRLNILRREDPVFKPATPSLTSLSTQELKTEGLWGSASLWTASLYPFTWREVPARRRIFWTVCPASDRAGQQGDLSPGDDKHPTR